MFATMMRFSGSVSGLPSRPGLKWIAMTFPSVELASSILPLKPQDRSVIPIVKASIRMASGFDMPGFQTVIVLSAEARAVIL